MLQIRLDAARLFLPGLNMDVSAEAGKQQGHAQSQSARGAGPAGAAGAGPRGRQEGRRRGEIYQLCMCGNGKLFLSAAEGLCAADDDSLVCR